MLLIQKYANNAFVLTGSYGMFIQDIIQRSLWWGMLSFMLFVYIGYIQCMYTLFVLLSSFGILSVTFSGTLPSTSAIIICETTSLPLSCLTCSHRGLFELGSCFPCEKCVLISALWGCWVGLGQSEFPVSSYSYWHLLSTSCPSSSQPPTKRSTIIAPYMLCCGLHLWKCKESIYTKILCSLSPSPLWTFWNSVWLKWIGIGNMHMYMLASQPTSLLLLNCMSRQS